MSRPIHPVPHLAHIEVPRHIEDECRAQGLPDAVAEGAMAVGLGMLKAAAHHEPLTLATALGAFYDWLTERRKA